MNKVIYEIKSLLKYIKCYQVCKKQLMELNELYKTYSIEGAYLSEKEDWLYNFKKLIYYTSGSSGKMDFIRAFYSEPVKKLKDGKNEKDFSKPVVVCAVRNDLPHMVELFKHYRKIGINNFAIIDNGSNDGTLEYLLEQEDASIYSVETKFFDFRKNGWRNQVIARMGLNHWYLYIDADELLVYPGMEKYDIAEYILRLEKRNIKQVNGIMLDMYPKYNLMDTTVQIEDMQKEYCWYDAYNPKYMWYKGNNVSGGMRNRLFGTKSLLSKKGPIYFEKGRFSCSSHNTFPLFESEKGNVNCMYLHYKFLPTDIKNYKRVVKEGIYHNNSFGYKKILKKFEEEKVNAFWEGSKKWTGSECMKDFPFMEDVSGYEE